MFMAIHVHALAVCELVWDPAGVDSYFSPVLARHVLREVLLGWWLAFVVGG